MAATRDAAFGTPRLTLGRRAGFASAAFALAIAMLGTTLPTLLCGLYRERFGFSELMITVIFATYAAGVIASLGRSRAAGAGVDRHLGHAGAGRG